jgi:cyclopropane fatty-acyl-phospholipid synthase-like methyltransferase
MPAAPSLIDSALQRGLIPDRLIRKGIRNLLVARLRQEERGSAEENQKSHELFIEAMKQSPIALQTREANEQHYEVPTEFFLQVLGKNLKYSCAYFDRSTQSSSLPLAQALDAAEDRMLDLTCDRVVSVEMFEHMRNWGELLKRVSKQVHPQGKFFMHIFTHREFSYLYEVRDETDWMSKYFFSGGMMPSDRLPLYFQNYFECEKHWRVNGTHYQKTSEAWLQRMDESREEIFPLFQRTYGEDQTQKWWIYWRIFFMACAELWGFRQGNEWFVSHYRFTKRGHA